VWTKYTFVKFCGVFICHAGNIITDDALLGFLIFCLYICLECTFWQESLWVHFQSFKQFDNNSLSLKFKMLYIRRFDDKGHNDLFKLFLELSKWFFKVSIQAKQGVLKNFIVPLREG